ncbi:MAG TPA: TIGR04086 family membrane protein [Segeticoccus sp.]|uniref:TIGR04086 family membrane protein n=1 Tax=Segeticoccus sp. TaxID=2706531 RepID=UPI002D7E4789|nr:TIGR04086 family membrane protein [Segeticoccus sp.]HET8601318.1 TIGR04086 family membrane protein [Segeticoccus sp.]
MSSTPDPGRNRGSLPSSEPDEPHDHRTLAERLTGFGRRHHGPTRGHQGGGATRAGAGSTGTGAAGLAGTTTPPRNVATAGTEYDTQHGTDGAGTTGAGTTGTTSTDTTSARPTDPGTTSARPADTGAASARPADTGAGPSDRTAGDEAGYGHDRYGDRYDDDRSHGDHSHTAATAGAGAAAGAAGAGLVGRHEAREDDRRTDDDRSDAELAAADNRYSRRDRDVADDTETVNDRDTVMARQRDRFGGARIATGFFGWMAATGLAVLMTALTEAIGTAFGANPATSIPAVTRTTGQTAKTIGWGGTIVLLIIMFLAYLGGGYVAGRMARFNGIRQGGLVWLWGLVVAVIITAIAHFAGTQYDILGLLNNFPRIPIDVGVTRWGIGALIVVAIAGLIGALLGGLWGMSFHRRVDRAGLPH